MDTHNILLLFSQKVKKILGDNLVEIILYGSYARGDFNENSDIDIMVLTTLSEEEIRNIQNDIFDLAFDFLMNYQVDISVILENDAKFKYWLGALPFFDNVKNEGIILWDAIPETEPDEIDLKMLDNIANNPDCKEFVSEIEALRLLGL